MILKNLTMARSLILALCIFFSQFRSIRSFGFSQIPVVPGRTQSICKLHECRMNVVGAPQSTTVIGAGPSGLATALMLARRGWSNITVYERLSRPPSPNSGKWGDPSRSYMIGIGGRGQVALGELEASDTVFSCCAEALGRMDWTPESTEPNMTLFTARKHKTKVMARDRLASCLLAEIEQKYPEKVKVNFDIDCAAVDWGGKDGLDPKVDKPIKLSLVPGPAKQNLKEVEEGAAPAGYQTDLENFEVTTDFVVGADGLRSAVRESMESDPDLTRLASKKPLEVHRFPNTNERVFRTITVRLGEGWRKDLNYSARTKDEVTLEMLPAKEGYMSGLVLFRPGNPVIESITKADAAKEYFYSNFPSLAPFIAEEDFEAFAVRPASRLPIFTYCGPILHMGCRGVLLGDTIKTVKPYFGLGANSALEDVMTLNKCLDDTKDDLTKALPLFSKRRAKEAKALVDLSRTFDLEGWRQICFFIFPIVMDGITHKLMPFVFKPNTIAYMQQAGVTFTQIQRRKWLDRFMQAALVFGTAKGTGQLCQFVLRRGIPAMIKLATGGGI